MGRPEPCVLFAQTFVHPHLDEYVDEVIFGEPIVITGCEFLEQSASSASSAVPLLGATSPPSFALEVFVQCEGEARFRRLCQPFLYSHSSSNVLELEAVVTNHLVVRGSYRSLSLVVYGNTAEDLGQFNVEFDLDSSLANLVSSSEAKLEDLPPLLHSRNTDPEETIYTFKALSPVLPAADISIEIRQFLQLVFRILNIENLSEFGSEVMGIISSTAASFFTNDLASSGIFLQKLDLGGLTSVKEPLLVFTEAKRNLVDFCKNHIEAGHMHGDFLAECSFLESEVDLASSKELVDMLFQHFKFDVDASIVGHPLLSESNNVLLWLSLALILCSGKESCFHYVNGGGMEQVALFLRKELNSATITLMLLGVMELATRYSVGCEGLLGWWPREDGTVPSGISEGYSQLLKLLMKIQRHDIASLVTYILHRLRFYEVASRYEYAVISILGGFSGVESATTSRMLMNAKLQLRKLLKLMSSSGWVEDPSPVACAIRSVILGPAEGELSFKATRKLIASSSCRFLHQEIDVKLLSLLKERGFLPLSVALISSSELRATIGHSVEAFIDVTSSIEAAILSLMLCRSGLIFLLQHPEISSTMIHAFKGGEDKDVNECIPLRYASVLISKGFFCRLREVGTNLELHLRVVNAVDRLLTSTPYSEEFLWILWELCGLSRTDCGHQALLALAHFPEATTILIEALHSAKKMETVALSSGTPVHLAIYHAAAELFEVIVTDTASSSVNAWIDHATDLHKALHSSSPGPSLKDAPTRLLEWIDAGVVYHKKGAIGVLRYAAVLASRGNDTSTSILTESMDVDKGGDTSNENEADVVENVLGNLVSDKSFDGIVLRDSSVPQLTTAIRILAHVSENLDIAVSLYDEGAMKVVYVILVDCRLMLERSSNNYDYLVGDGKECSSTSESCLERNQEKFLVDLLIPTLQLLLELLLRLKDTKEQHRNTKLMHVLLRLHRELSPKLAACAADLSSSYPDSALSLETVCHLIASALAYWPAHAWTPGLFSTLLDSVQAASSMALGPKETCSMLCLLIDLFPEEGVWHWKNGMPLLTAVRSLAIGSRLGPLMEKNVNWYLENPHVEVLLCQLSPHFDKIAKLILHYAVSTLIVVQDMLRVFVVRIARLKVEKASVLLQPIFSWIRNHLIESSSLGDIDAYKGYKLLNFLSHVLEHPLAKPLLLKEGVVRMLTKVLGKIDAHLKSISDGRTSVNSGFDISNCCLPVLRSLFWICDDTRSGTKLLGVYDCQEFLSMEDYVLILDCVFKFCQVLPVGKELLACLAIFKGLVSHAEGQKALLEVSKSGYTNDEKHPGRYDRSTDTSWRECPLLCCLVNIYRSVENEGLSSNAIEAAGMLSSGAVKFCMDGKSFIKDRIKALKSLFGVSCVVDGINEVPEENLKCIQDLPALLSSKMDEEIVATSHVKTTSLQVADSARSLSLLLVNSGESLKVNDMISEDTVLLSCDVPVSSKIHLLIDSSSEKVEDEFNVGELGDVFQWECPENLRDRSLLGKRKMSVGDVPNRHGKGESAATEVRGSGLSIAPPIPNRRDPFRQRKPNTSRPPSMHVDDYVARERNADSSTNPNVIAVQRLGSSGGRPPSIHVDEFMARQRERQNGVAMAGVDSASQTKKVALENATDKEKSNRLKPLKVDLDDDLQGIDIVFDAEENEPDDKLPFPQADDNLQQTASASAQQSPQHSIVEETQSDTKDLGVTVASNVDDNAQSELSSRMSVSKPAIKLRREPSVSSEKKFFEQPDERKNNSATIPAGVDSTAAAKPPGFSALAYGKGSPSLSQLPTDSRIPPPNFVSENYIQRSGRVPVGLQGQHEPKQMSNQAPLPPTPPPLAISPAKSQGSDTTPGSSSAYVSTHNALPPPLYPTYHVQTEYQSPFGNVSASLSTSNVMLDPRITRPSHSSPGGPARSFPPLPPTTSPFSANHNMLSRSPTSQSSVYGQNKGGAGEASQFAPSTMMPPGFSRPPSIPFAVHGNAQVQQSDNITGNAHGPQSQVQYIQSFPHLQPLQPPQLPGPQLLNQLRPLTQSSQQLEQSSSLSQGHVQMVAQPQQVLQQSQMSQYQLYYQPQQQDNSPRPQQQPQAQRQQADAVTQQQMDSAMTLQQYFSSPEAIQSLLSDRDKLCQLLEQHPKLMQMLQERLGQL